VNLIIKVKILGMSETFFRLNLNLPSQVSMVLGMLHAAESGDEETVVQLLAQGSDTTVVDPSSEQTALHLAAKGGHLGIVELFLAHCPALIEAVDCFYDTALHLAAGNGHDAIVQLLLSERESMSAHRVLLLALRCIVLPEEAMSVSSDDCLRIHPCC